MIDKIRLHKENGMRIFLLVLSFSLLCLMPLTAADGSKTVRLYGKTAAGVLQRVSVAQIEKKLDRFTFRIYNPYEKREHRYSGVLLERFIDKFAAPGTSSVTFTAIDDYTVTLKQRDWTSKRILLVTRKDGTYMDIKDKGPLMIVFPDYDPRSQAYQVNLPDWIWMITKIEFRATADAQ